MKRIYLFAQGQLGNNLFILAYAIYLLRNSHRKVTIYSDCEDLASFCKGSDIMLDGKIQIKKWPNWMIFYLKVRSRFTRGLVEWFTRKIDKVFGILFIDKVWEIPAEDELSRWNVGFFQDARFALLVKEELLEIMRVLTTRTIQNASEESIFNLCQNEKYIAVHLRRGEYRNIPEYGLIAPSFVDTETIGEKFRVLVSSDELGIESELEMWQGKIEYLNVSNLSTIEAFVVLAGASKIYLSNSTFAWWAGFFVNLRGGDVICPSPWFKNARVPIDYLLHPHFNYKRAIFS